MRHLALLLVLLAFGCSRSEKEYVVLYTSQDQFYAEPILKDFTAKTGIEVRPVFDSESAKTAGLARRVRAEAFNPQCDVFWSNEEMHTRLLVRDGIIRSNEWRSAGSRTRRLVYNTNKLSAAHLPASLLELTNGAWSGRIALAYPLFGTTKSHFFALRQLWGEQVWKDWCHGLVRNGAKVVDGNSLVVKLVGAGECLLGLTDSDDIDAGLHQGLPIRSTELMGELIAIPSTMGLIRDAPHPAAGRALIEYLSGKEALERLVALGALESTSTAPAPGRLFEVNWDEALKDEAATIAFLEFIFVRS